jgi:hypothetical protein
VFLFFEDILQQTTINQGKIILTKLTIAALASGENGRRLAPTLMKRAGYFYHIRNLPLNGGSSSSYGGRTCRK